MDRVRGVISMSIIHTIGGVASGGGPQNYVKGYPSAGPVEPNVAAMWEFSESSGNIVDLVSGLTLVPGGSQTYNVSGGAGLYADITPGITCLSFNSYFDKNPDTSLAIGTSDFVLEIWFSASTLRNGCAFFSTGDNTGDEDGFVVYYATGNKIAVWFRATDSTLVSSNVTVTSPADMADGSLHKMRLAGVRSGNCSVYVDGVLAGNIDISSLSGKTLAAYHAAINTWYAGGAGVSESTATFYSVRLTIGNATNNSGGPNGG